MSFDSTLENFVSYTLGLKQMVVKLYSFIACLLLKPNYVSKSFSRPETEQAKLTYSIDADLIQFGFLFMHMYLYWKWQDTVDAVRTSERERIKINEALMGLLFRLDSVPGINPNVRELRRHVSRKIVGLQEILDAVSDAKLEHWDGFLRDWDDMVEGIEREVCKEKGGGYELEKFCAEHLGFQCFQRFLRDQ